MVAWALMLLPQVWVGPPTVVLDRGESYYFNPDAAFPLFRTREGKQAVMWGPGRPTRYLGTCLDDMAQVGPSPAPVVRAPGIGKDYDSAGSWMLAASRAPDGKLVALVHTEDHTFAQGLGEWNSSGILLSEDDGQSWTNLGQVVGEAKPEKGRFGGLDLRVMVWNRQRNSWIAYSGAYAFESKDPHAAPGSWYGYYQGSFSQKIDPSQPAPPLSEMPGLKDVTWGSLSWNSYFKKYLYIWREPGGFPSKIYMALSADALNWETPSVLVDVLLTPEQSVDYPNLVGESSSETGQDCRLIYAQSPSTGLRRKDMVERQIHFGPLGKPQTPAGIRASGEPGFEEGVTVSWVGVPMAQVYEVWRKGAAGWARIATVRSSSARPEYVDRVKSGIYRVASRNAKGVSGFSAVVQGRSVRKTFRIIGVESGLPLQGFSDNPPSLQASSTGPEQQWRFDDGRIINVATGFAFQLSGARAGQTSMKMGWDVKSTGPTFALVDRAGGMCLDALGHGKGAGTRVGLYPYGGAANQQWRIERV